LAGAAADVIARDSRAAAAAGDPDVARLEARCRLLGLDARRGRELAADALHALLRLAAACIERARIAQRDAVPEIGLAEVALEADAALQDARHRDLALGVAVLGRLLEPLGGELLVATDAAAGVVGG